MVIQIKKFGTTLTSRPFGQEAYGAFKPTLKELKDNEAIFIDFSGVNTFSPSWGDEFLTPLMQIYKNRIYIKKTDNPSVIETLSLLEEVHGFKFIIVE